MASRPHSRIQSQSVGLLALAAGRGSPVDYPAAISPRQHSITGRPPHKPKDHEVADRSMRFARNLASSRIGFMDASLRFKCFQIPNLHCAIAASRNEPRSLGPRDEF